MSRHPEGWAASTLGDLCEIVSGSTPRTGDASNWGGDIPWITPDDLSQLRGKTINRGARSITPTGYESCSTSLMPRGAVLYTSRAPIGYVAIAADSVCTNQGFKSFVPSVALVSDYLYWFLIHATPEIRKLGSGTTFPELSKSAAKTIAIPVPPREEQQRIVAAIEEKLSRLDAAVHALEAASARADLLRLVLLNEVTKLAGRIVPTGEVAEVQGGIQKQPKRRPVKNRFPFLRVANVRRGSLDLDEVHEVELFDGELERFALRSGDLLVVEGNGSPQQIGRSATWNGEIENCVHQNHLIRIRPGASLDSDFLNLYWNAPSTIARIRAVASSTSGLYTLSTAKVKAVDVLVPTLDDQRHTVATIEEQFALITALEDQIAAARRRASGLRRAVLASAFRGNLTRQNSEDEPASALIQRVAANPPAAALKRRLSVTA